MSGSLGELKPPSSGWVMLPPAPKARPDGKLTDTELRAIWSALGALASTINGNLTFGAAEPGAFAGNFDAEPVVDFTFPSVADTEVAVPHLLRRVPIGYIPIMQDRAGTVYASSIGSWTESWIHLKCNAAGMVARLLLF